MKTVLTYGTFDTLHWGHINILRRAYELAGPNGRLIVGLSTDEFNAGKGKQAYHSYETRKQMLSAIRYVDQIIPEKTWDQKVDDIKKYHADALVMGDDWADSDKFDHLKEHTKLIFLPRTKSISSTQIRRIIKEDEEFHSGQHS